VAVRKSMFTNRLCLSIPSHLLRISHAARFFNVSFRLDISMALVPFRLPSSTTASGPCRDSDVLPVDQFPIGGSLEASACASAFD